VESYDRAALTNRECGHPNWDEPVLAEGQSELGMAEDLNEEFSIASGGKQSVSGRTAEREAADHL
jgi:hypothetical protein